MAASTRWRCASRAATSSSVSGSNAKRQPVVLARAALGARGLPMPLLRKLGRPKPRVERARRCVLADEALGRLLPRRAVLPRQHGRARTRVGRRATAGPGCAICSDLVARRRLWLALLASSRSMWSIVSPFTGGSSGRNVRHTTRCTPLPFTVAYSSPLAARGVCLRDQHSPRAVLVCTRPRVDTRVRPSLSGSSFHRSRGTQKRACGGPSSSHGRSPWSSGGGACRNS